MQQRLASMGQGGAGGMPDMGALQKMMGSMGGGGMPDMSGMDMGKLMSMFGGGMGGGGGGRR